jgi:hypothetical protein
VKDESKWPIAKNKLKNRALGLQAQLIIIDLQEGMVIKGI